MSITPTQATKVAKWLQVLLIILQIFGSAIKAVPNALSRGLKSARRR